MKQAIILLIHKDVKQAERLINYFQGKCDIFIHIDRKSGITESDINNLKTMHGVIDVYRKYNIHWGGFSILKAELFMLKRAIEYSDFNYIHLLSGQDYPIKPLSMFLDKFDNNNNDYISCSHMPTPNTDENTFRRFQFYFFMDLFKPKTEEEIENMWELTRRQEKWGIRRQIFKPFLHLYIGSCWYSLTRKSIIALLDYTKRNPYFYRKMRFTFAPDEIYINTVLVNIDYPKKELCNSNCRYIKWPKAGANHPIILKEENFEELAQTNAFFTRKVDMEASSALLKLVDKYLISEENPKFHTNGIREQRSLFKYPFDYGLSSAIIKLCHILDIKTAIDLGCGPGFYVSALQKAGIVTHGYDGNPYITEQSQCIISQENLLCRQISIHEPITIDYPAELALFLNVGEYIPKEFENVVLDNLCKITRKYLIVSWQDNIKLNVDEENHIVNPIPNDALMQKLIERGFKNDVVLTQNLRDSSSLNVNRNCICVFKKHNSAQRIFRDDS